MNTTTYEIVEKTRLEPFDIVGIGDFELRESGTAAPEEILHNRQITLYALDFESKRAVFVDTPSDIDLSQSPFMYMTQYDHATRVLMTSFETMIQLGQSVSLDDRRLVFLHSTCPGFTASIHEWRVQRMGGWCINLEWWAVPTLHCCCPFHYRAIPKASGLEAATLWDVLQSPPSFVLFV